MKTSKVLIVGGSGGIGREIVKLLLAQDFYIINIDRVSLNVNMPNYNEVVVDLTISNVDNIVEAILSQNKDIYGFISAIGYYGVGNLDTYSRNEYNKTVFINVEIPTLISIKLSQNMKSNKGGKMIFVSSAAAYVGSRDIPYSISKSAILGLLKGLSKNLKNTNVYTYCVAPGIVKTNMSDQMSDNRKQDTIQGTLNNRECNPEEIARIIRFLLVEDDGYMNGSVVHVNNGLYLN